MGLAEILAKKRADAALPKPTVKMYVALFMTSPRELYLNYFEGLRLLIDWLGQPVSSGVKGDIPRMLGSYEVQEIASYLQVDQYEVWLEAYKAIAATLPKAE